MRSAKAESNLLPIIGASASSRDGRCWVKRASTRLGQKRSDRLVYAARCEGIAPTWDPSSAIAHRNSSLHRQKFPASFRFFW